MCDFVTLNMSTEDFLDIVDCGLKISKERWRRFNFGNLSYDTGNLQGDEPNDIDKSDVHILIPPIDDRALSFSSKNEVKNIVRPHVENQVETVENVETGVIDEDGFSDNEEPVSGTDMKQGYTSEVLEDILVDDTDEDDSFSINEDDFSEELESETAHEVSFTQDFDEDDSFSMEEDVNEGSNGDVDTESDIFNDEFNSDNDVLDELDSDVISEDAGFTFEDVDSVNEPTDIYNGIGSEYESVENTKIMGSNILLNEKPEIAPEILKIENQRVTNSQSPNDIIIESSDVRFNKGMTLVEFLRGNPKIRQESEVLEYFSKEEIKKAIKQGKIMCKKGRIIL